MALVNNGNTRVVGGVTISRSWLFILIAFVFFLLATLIAGGVITANLPWLLPAGLTTYMVALLV
jgi:hypothetical protein